MNYQDYSIDKLTSYELEYLSQYPDFQYLLNAYKNNSPVAFDDSITDVATPIFDKRRHYNTRLFYQNVWYYYQLPIGPPIFDENGEIKRTESGQSVNGWQILCTECSYQRPNRPYFCEGNNRCPVPY